MTSSVKSCSSIGDNRAIAAGMDDTIMSVTECVVLDASLVVSESPSMSCSEEECSTSMSRHNGCSEEWGGELTDATLEAGASDDDDF